MTGRVLSLDNPELGIFLGQDDDAKVIYHYTNYDSFLSILENKKIFCTDSRYLNDYKEIEHAFDIALNLLPEHLDDSHDKKGILEDLDKNRHKQFEFDSTYIGSFSLVRDSLPQWRAYCTNGGVALGFEVKQLKSALRNYSMTQLEFSSYLGKCIYEEKPKRKLIDLVIEEHLAYYEMIRKFPGNDRFSSSMLLYSLSLFAPFLKDGSFKEEEEVRIRVNRGLPTGFGEASGFIPEVRVGSLGLTPYVPVELKRNNKRLILKEVVIGPSENQELLINSIKHLIHKYNLSDVELVKSDVPYRTS